MNNHSVTVCLRHKRQNDIKVSPNQSFGEVKKFICEENNLNLAKVRLFYDGQRIMDNDNAQTLNLNDGDTIDVFLEIKGGGWPTKRLKDIDNEEISNLLHYSDDEEMMTEGIETEKFHSTQQREQNQVKPHIPHENETNEKSATNPDVQEKEPQKIEVDDCMISNTSKVECFDEKHKSAYPKNIKVKYHNDVHNIHDTFKVYQRGLLLESIESKRAECKKQERKRNKKQKHVKEPTYQDKDEQQCYGASKAEETNELIISPKKNDMKEIEEQHFLKDLRNDYQKGMLNQNNNFDNFQNVVSSPSLL